MSTPVVCETCGKAFRRIADALAHSHPQPTKRRTPKTRELEGQQVLGVEDGDAA